MCSDRGGAVFRLAPVLTIAALIVSSARGRALLSVDEALRLAFPGATVERESVFLTEAQLEAATASAGEPVRRALVVRYVARRDGALAGTAYLDVHTVRTLEETLFVVVEPDGTIGHVETLSFAEPPDYLPRAGWYAQFAGRGLDEELRLDRGIRAVSGATLTATATTAAVRRVLAVHRVIENPGTTP